MRICIILITLCFLSCNSNNPIPEDITFNLLKEESVFPYEIKVYEIEVNNLNIPNIIKEKVSCFGSKKPILWERTNNLQSSFKYYLLKEIESLSNSSENFKELLNLNQKLKSTEKIYFTGCYSLTKDIKGKSIPAYNFMYFLDIENQQFYSFEFKR